MAETLRKQMKQDRTMHQIGSMLRLATLAIDSGNTLLAIDCLQDARLMAREGNTQRSRAISVHCTVAIQALLPVSLEGMI